MFETNVHQGLIDSLNKSGTRPDSAKKVKFNAKLNKKQRRGLQQSMAALRIQPDHLIIAYDSAPEIAPGDRKAFEQNALRQDHVGYAVQAYEYGHWMAPGSCLQLADERIFCGAKKGYQAYQIRSAVHFDVMKELRASAPGGNTGKAAVKVNRLGGSRVRKSSGCGGGTFCKVEQ